jgi:alpha-amylase/alpha-mannosidase (GH57 family)
MSNGKVNIFFYAASMSLSFILKKLKYLNKRCKIFKNVRWEIFTVSEILNPHGSEDVDYGLLGCSAV